MFSVLYDAYCIECGKELGKTNELEYVEHVFEDGRCEKCGFKKVVETTSITREEYEYATRRNYQLQGYADLVKEAIRRGDILSKDIVGTGEAIYAKINDYSDVKNGKRKLAYYQIVKGLEVTGYITEETYNSLMRITSNKEYLKKVEAGGKKLSTKELLEAISNGILRIQVNRNSKNVCEDIYQEIEVYVELLKQKPEYQKNKSLKDIDWFVSVDSSTPSFKDLVDSAFTRENIYENAYGTEVVDYLKQYKHRVVINYLTVVDGLIILGTSGAIGYEVAKTGTLTLTVKGKSLFVTKEVAIGYDFGKFGQYVSHINMEITQTSKHALKRMAERGMTIELANKIVAEGKTVLQAGGDKIAYVTREGVVIVSKFGRLITVWTAEEFDSAMTEIVKLLFGR